jgi:UDP-3-O-[3-hydroxymyristoyl] glucosamine N-acyltransferase
LIQIGHNVKIGDGTAIAACCGIAGSAVIGRHCLIGGGTNIVGHIQIGDFVNLVGSSNVGQSISEPGAYASGITTTEIKTWKRNLVRFHQLDELATRLFELERKLKEA